MGRVLEQYRSGLVLPVKTIYVVTHCYQAQECNLIAAFTEMCDAYKMARKYNKNNGQHCIFTKEGDFVEYDMKGDPDYYDVTELPLNKRMKQ